MKFEYGIIIVLGFLVFVILALVASNPNEVPSFAHLNQINQQALFAQETENKGKLEANRSLMQEKLEEIANNSLGINISISDEFASYFPYVKGSQVEIPQGKDPFPVCDVVENIPIHLQEIRKVKMFQMYIEKYSKYPIELFLQDERAYESLFHYGFKAKSDDGKSALTYFHANSCTNEIVDVDNYFLSCHDEKQDYIFGTKNHDDILASLNHAEFCIIPLDPWRQSFYDYGKTVSLKLTQHQEQAETMDKSLESVMAFQSEMQRLGLLSDLGWMFVSDTSEDDIIDKKIQEYEHRFGPLPDDFLELLENEN